MTAEVFERFLNPSERAIAVVELVAREDVVTLLASFFSREARNEFGSPYRDIGAYEPALVAAARLGPRAKPLEAYLREAASDGWPQGATALGQLGTLDQASVDCLVRVVAQGRVEAQAEALGALVRCGHGALPAIERLGESSEPWRRTIASLRSE